MNLPVTGEVNAIIVVKCSNAGKVRSTWCWARALLDGAAGVCGPYKDLADRKKPEKLSHASSWPSHRNFVQEKGWMNSEIVPWCPFLAGGPVEGGHSWLTSAYYSLFLWSFDFNISPLDVKPESSLLWHLKTFFS